MWIHHCFEPVYSIVFEADEFDVAHRCLEETINLQHEAWEADRTPARFTGVYYVVDLFRRGGDDDKKVGFLSQGRIPVTLSELRFRSVLECVEFIAGTVGDHYVEGAEEVYAILSATWQCQTPAKPLVACTHRPSQEPRQKDVSLCRKQRRRFLFWPTTPTHRWR